MSTKKSRLQHMQLLKPELHIGHVSQLGPTKGWSVHLTRVQWLTEIICKSYNKLCNNYCTDSWLHRLLVKLRKPGLWWWRKLQSCPPFSGICMLLLVSPSCVSMLGSLWEKTQVASWLQVSAYLVLRYTYMYTESINGCPSPSFASSSCWGLKSCLNESPTKI